MGLCEMDFTRDLEGATSSTRRDELYRFQGATSNARVGTIGSDADTTTAEQRGDGLKMRAAPFAQMRPGACDCVGWLALAA